MASGYIETNGGRLYHEIEGAGHPLLLIHAGVANLRMWDEQAAAFAPHYRVIRYDTRGFGLTETDDVAFSNRADVGAVLDHAGADSAFVIGASRGGSIALDFALEAPERVDALVIVAGDVGGLAVDVGEEARSLFEEAERRWEAEDWDWLTGFETAYWVDGPGQPSSRVAPEIRARVEEWIGTNYRAEKEEGRPVPLQPPAVERLHELRVPTLVIVGELDAQATQRACEHLAAHVVGARLEVLPGAAHMLNLEQPGRFNETVLDFLGTASHGGGPATTA